LGNYTKYNKQIPHIVENKGIIIEANKEFFDFTGFNKKDIFHKSLTSVWIELLRVTVEPYHMEDREAFLFTKAGDAKLVEIKNKKNINNNCITYTFNPTYCNILDENFPFLIEHNEGTDHCIALLNVPNFLILKANNQYFDLIKKEKIDAVGIDLKKIVKGFENSPGHNVFKKVCESGERYYNKEFKLLNPTMDNGIYWSFLVSPIFIKAKLKYLIVILRNLTEDLENRDSLITRHSENEMKIKQQKEQLEAVIENIADALVIYDKMGNFTHFNAEARKLYAEINYQNTRDNVHNGFDYFDLEDNIIPKENLPSVRAFKGETIRNERIVIKRPNRNQVTEINATPIYDDKNNLASVVISHRDISEDINNQAHIKNQQEQLLIAEKEKIEALKEAYRVKDEFFYLITHELKTPLAIINMALQAIELLCKGEISERVNKYLKTINQNTNRQLRLVNNLLDITRINSSQMKINRTNFNIVYVIKAIVNSVQLYAERKNVKLKFTSGLSVKDIYFDEEKLERILLNLLSNALKFTPSGKSITVTLSMKKNKDASMMCISVEDEGTGIPIEKQKIIFERFGQADTTLSRQSEGTGLGLYLVKLLVNVLGGEISLISKVGKGSTFTVLLPATKALDIDEIAAGKEANMNLTNGNKNIIQTAMIEFSDIYF